MNGASGHDGRDWLTRVIFGTAAAIAVAAVLSIFAFLAYFASPLLTAEGFVRMIDWTWRPAEGSYGILPMVMGSLLMSVCAMTLAFPAALMVCAFAHGIGPRGPSRVVMTTVNLMTGIPTIVYAFAAAMTLPPFLRQLFAGGTGFSLVGASLVLGVLALPTIVLVIDSSWSGVAATTRHTCAALGMSPTQHIFGVLIPASRAGLLAAFVLGFGRALGDTMVALMLSGNVPLIPVSPIDSIRALTAHISLVMSLEVGGPGHQSAFAAGFVLLMVTSLISVAVRRLGRQSGPRA